MKINDVKQLVRTQLNENGIISEQYIEHPFKVKPKEIEAFLKKYPQVEKSMKPFVSARIMQGYRKWLTWKNKNEDKLGGTPNHVSSPSFGEKTFYKHDFGNIQGWAAIFQYITAKQLKDPSLYSSKNESINETTKADIDKQKAELLKKVNVLVDKKKKLYSKVDISSPMSADEKKLDKEIADLFSQINGLVMKKRKLTESSNTPKMAKSGKDIFVDTTFVQLSNRFGKLDHIWGGDFVVKTKEGDVEFQRVGKRIDGFTGRTHKLVGDSKATASLIKNMKPEVVKESVNESKLDFSKVKKGDKLIGKFPPYKELEVISSNGKNSIIAKDLKSGKSIEINSTNNYKLKESMKLKEIRNLSESTAEPKIITQLRDVEFQRVGKRIDGFTGRTHKLVGDSKAAAVLIKNMKPEVVKESVNESSRRATDFYGDSKHGRALHSLLKGKWDSNKVERYLDKVGGGNDVKYARVIDFISGDVGLNIRKYNNINQQLPDLMKQLETLYNDFLTESINESKYSNRADAMTAFFKGKISGKELDTIARRDFGSAIAVKGELNQFLKNSFMQDVMADQYGIPKATLVKKVKELLPIVESVNERATKKINSLTYKGSKEIQDLLKSDKWRLIGRNGFDYEFLMIEGLTEATITSIPQFNLESDAYIAMFNMLKNNPKFKKVVATSMLAYFSGGNPKNILTALRGMLAKGIVTDKLINGTVAVLNKRSPRISVSPQQASTPKVIDQFSGVLAAGLLFDFRENTIDTAKMTGDKNVVNAANDFSVNRGKEKFKTMMGNKFESISESKKVDWKDFYTRAKDTSGYDPSFEKKYGRLLDLPHITDALNRTSDFKSFMKFISKFESVVDDSGMQRVGTALPQTDEEPIEESSNEPKIITQLRDVMKSGYKKLKDPKSGKTMTVDSYSASAIVKVYDALNQQNKEKFANAGLLGMQSMAFKLIK